MARIRQQFPQNYGSSGNINTEFESVIRYLNAAEYGNKTLGELLDVLYDKNGEFDGPIELQKNTGGDIEYRIGEYSNDQDGWILLCTAEELRGEPGQDFGIIGAPIMYNRIDYLAEQDQQSFLYAQKETDEVLVYLEGLLQVEGVDNDYTCDLNGGEYGAGTVEFNWPLQKDMGVTLYKIRATAITGYKRKDFLTVDPQVVFPFVHDDTAKLQVYLNGILQREGGEYDYVANPEYNVITFVVTVPEGNVVTIFTVENTSVQAATGLMFEEEFCNTAAGLILLEKVEIENESIPQAKIVQLTSMMDRKANIDTSDTLPLYPVSGDLWHDTSHAPNELKFWDGTQWVKTSPESSLPTYTPANAGQYVKVNGTGTALEYGSVDLSGAVPVTQKGAANGVATLDSSGKLPVSQLPTLLGSDSYYFYSETPAAQPYTVKRIFKQKIQIDGISIFTESGTCSIQITVNGQTFGSVYSASSSLSEFSIGQPIEIDASTSSKSIGFVLTNNSSAYKLEVTMAVNVLAN